MERKKNEDMLKHAWRELRQNGTAQEGAAAKSQPSFPHLIHVINDPSERKRVVPILKLLKKQSSDSFENLTGRRKSKKLMKAMEEEYNVRDENNSIFITEFLDSKVADIEEDGDNVQDGFHTENSLNFLKHWSKNENTK
jgi:hypothetical protein